MNILFIFLLEIVFSISAGWAFVPEQDAGLSQHEWRLCAQFIETQAEALFKQGQLYIEPRPDLPCPIEKDRKTGAVFIHLKGRQGALLGKGSFKIVTKSILYGSTPILVARCQVKQSGEFERRALECMKGVQGVVQGYAYLERPKKRCDLILEYYNYGSFQNIVKGKLRIPDSDILSIMYDLVSGLKGMHERGYFHGDIKPLNIFLNLKRGKIQAVLGDLGCAWKYEPVSPSSFRVFTMYRKENILSHVEINTKRDRDIYKLGTILYLMLFPEQYVQNPYHLNCSESVLNSVIGFKRDAGALAFKMLQSDASKKISITEVFQEVLTIAKKWG